MQLPPGVTKPALARASFLYYLATIFELKPYSHIRLIAEQLENTDRQCAVVMPPGFGKSTIVSQLYPSWYLGNHPDRSVLLISSTDKQAKLFLDANQVTMAHHQGWKETFPDVAPDPDRGWSRDGLFLKWRRDPNSRLLLPDWKSKPATMKDPGLCAFGIGGPVIGRRADLIIVDDPYSEEMARSDVQRQAFLDWFRRTLMSRLKPDPHCKIIVVMTRWHPDDIIAWMNVMNEEEKPKATR